MTQMTQSRLLPWAPDLRFLGHLGHTKTNDPNDPNDGMHIKTHDPNDPKTGGHAGSSLRFKTMTQMTKMTQRLAGT